MAHTFTALQALVEQHNQDALTALAAARPTMLPASPRFNPGCADFASTLPTQPLGSWSGILSKQRVPTYDLVRDALDLGGSTAAVFSIVDDFKGFGPAPEGDLPVVLCVGINYTQMPSYVPGLTLTSDTEMRNSTSKVLGQSANSFHLVAANFFPWVTVDSWEEARSGKALNSLHEALLMETCGFADPVNHARSLAAALNPEWIIFHGVNNCVPSLGMRVWALLQRDVIFCDNISPWYSGQNNIRY